MTDCKHTGTMGREGQTGSWCVNCGVKVMEVHDRPCGECVHLENLGNVFDPYWRCIFHRMRVTPSMKVTYYIGKPPGEHVGGGLCFVAKDDY
jgi:hypothetical protein